MNVKSEKAHIAEKFAEELKEILFDDCFDFPHMVHGSAHKSAKMIEWLCAEIGRLENELEEAMQEKDSIEAENIVLEDKMNEVKHERDAAIADLTAVCETVNTCLACDHYRPDWEKPGCELNGLLCAWKWRGLKGET